MPPRARGERERRRPADPARTSPPTRLLFFETAASAAPGPQLDLVEDGASRDAQVRHAAPRRSEYSMERCRAPRGAATRGRGSRGERVRAAQDHCSGVVRRPTATVVSASACVRIGRASCTQCPSGEALLRHAELARRRDARARAERRDRDPAFAPDEDRAPAARAGRVRRTRPGRGGGAHARGREHRREQRDVPAGSEGIVPLRLAPVPTSRVSRTGSAPSDAGSAASASSPVGGSAQAP